MTPLPSLEAELITVSAENGRIKIIVVSEGKLTKYVASGRVAANLCGDIARAVVDMATTTNVEYGTESSE